MPLRSLFPKRRARSRSRTMARSSDFSIRIRSATDGCATLSSEKAQSQPAVADRPPRIARWLRMQSLKHFVAHNWFSQAVLAGSGNDALGRSVERSHVGNRAGRFLSNTGTSRHSWRSPATRRIRSKSVCAGLLACDQGNLTADDVSATVDLEHDDVLDEKILPIDTAKCPRAVRRRRCSRESSRVRSQSGTNAVKNRAGRRSTLTGEPAPRMNTRSAEVIVSPRQFGGRPEGRVNPHRAISNRFRSA